MRRRCLLRALPGSSLAPARFLDDNSRDGEEDGESWCSTCVLAVLRALTTHFGDITKYHQVCDSMSRGAPVSARLVPAGDSRSHVLSAVMVASRLLIRPSAALND